MARTADTRAQRVAKLKKLGGPSSYDNYLIERRLYEAKVANLTPSQLQQLSYQVGGDKGFKLTSKAPPLKHYKTLRAVLETGRYQDYERLERSYLATAGKKGKSAARKNVLKKDSEFWRAVQVLYDADRKDAARRRMGEPRPRQGPQSKKARALVTLGLREPGATNNVGEGYSNRRLEGRDAVRPKGAKRARL